MTHKRERLDTGSAHELYADESAGHERSDASIRGLIIFGGCLAAGCALVLLFVYWLFGTLQAAAFRADPPPPALGPPPREFPSPQLEHNPQANAGEDRARQAARLQDYRWIDRGAGVVQIPIERAMELIDERGMPHWEPAAPAAVDHGSGDR